MLTKKSIDIDVKFVIEDLKRKTEELVENSNDEKKNNYSDENKETKALNAKEKLVNGNNLNVSNLLNNNLLVQIKTNEVVSKIQTFPKVMIKNNKKERKLLPKSSLSINNTSINNLNINSGLMQLKTTSSIVNPTNTNSSFFTNSNIINISANKEMPKLLPKTTQANQEKQSLSSISNKKDIVLSKKTVKPRSIAVFSTSSTIIPSTCSEKSVKEVVTNLQKNLVNISENNSLTKTTNTIDTVMSEVLNTSAQSNKNLSTNSEMNSLSFLNLKNRKRAPARSRLIKKFYYFNNFN